MLYKMKLLSNVPNKKDLDKAYARTQNHIKGLKDQGLLFTLEGFVCERDIVYKVILYDQGQVSHLMGNTNPTKNGRNGYTRYPRQAKPMKQNKVLA